MAETQEVRDKVVLVGLNSPVLKKEEWISSIPPRYCFGHGPDTQPVRFPTPDGVFRFPQSGH